MLSYVIICTSLNFGFLDGLVLQDGVLLLRLNADSLNSYAHLTRVNAKAPFLLLQLLHLLLHFLSISVTLHQTLVNKLNESDNEIGPTLPAWTLRRSALQTPHCANLEYRVRF